MSQIDDLKAAVARLTASTTAELAAIATKLSNPDPDINGAVAAINSLSDQLDAETAALTVKVP